MKIRTMHVGAIVAAVLCSAAAAAEESLVPVAFDIRPQPIGKALADLGAQAGLNVLVRGEDVHDRQALSQPVNGKLPVRTALDQVLANSGLTYEFLDERTVRVRQVGASGSPADGRVTLAQASPGAPAAQATDGARTEGPQSGSSPSPISVEEIVVTGTQIRGIRNDTAPMLVLTRSDIDASGYSSLSSLIESLPQNFALANESTTPITGVTNARTQGSSINLRGIGEGSTLVLVNGRRIAPGFLGSAVDISMLPLSAIERIEVLTDGASALYGSDAVGGVVNLILRKDFDGAETRLRAGRATGDLSDYRASQSLGTSWASGDVMLSLEYSKRDLLEASDRSFVPSNSLIGSLLPKNENYSGIFSVRQDITDSVSAFFDGLYAKRDTFNKSGIVSLSEDTRSKVPQTSATAGLRWQFGGDWALDATGGYSSNELEQVQRTDSIGPGGAFLIDSKFELATAGVKSDGTVMRLPGGRLRAAIGAEWRAEDYHQSFAYTVPIPAIVGDSDQTVRSAFAELFVPIYGDTNAVPGIRRLELSIAGRYDDYSNFGSSFDPRFGIAWEPVSGLRFRGSYGTSYLAPKLSDYFRGENTAIALTSPDPGVPAGFSRQLLLSGVDASNLTPQESESYSFGIDFMPLDKDLKVGLNYFHINYEDRIANPPGFIVILSNPAAYGSLFFRNPSAADVNAAIAEATAGGVPLIAFNPDFTPDLNFDPATIDVIVDTRRRNLSVVETSGLDLSATYQILSGANEFTMGLSATYILDLEQKATPTADVFEIVGTIFNPPDWRARASFGWVRARWSANLFVNHVDSYTDNRVSVPISSYTTVDTQLAYSFGTAGYPASGVSVSLNARNLFDKDPPATAIFTPESDMGFDPTNASPLGRVIGIELTKIW